MPYKFIIYLLYTFVGADVDSEELWIASIFGDAVMGLDHGATPLGKMVLTGTKEEGTDMHSVVAEQSGINRGTAKVMNYARLYGGGEKLATQTLLKHSTGYL